MNFSVPPELIQGPPDSLSEIDIPGFPKDPTRPEGFMADLQGHLHHLSVNANAIHHILEALCGGLDRLEKKVDFNSSQVEERLANIVHHMTGEADEETMSAWGSFDAAASPSEIVRSLVLRRTSRGSRPAEPLGVEPLPKVATKESSHDVGANLLGDSENVVSDIIPRDAGRDDLITPGLEDSTVKDEASPIQPTTSNRNQIEAVVLSEDGEVAEPKKLGDEQYQTEEKHIEKPQERLTGTKSPRHGSGNNVLSEKPESTPHREGEIASNQAQARGVERRNSIASAALDARYLARKRWIWAIGRVCHLLRRRKRQEFEIMSQRATDRAIRMGSRISVVEKRLDDIHASLLWMDRLKVRAVAHSDGIKMLTQKVTELTPLLGVEDRLRGLVGADWTKMEGMIDTKNGEMAAKLRAGQEESESRLEDQLARMQGRLDDMEDRFAMSDATLRPTEERPRESHEICEEVHKQRVDKIPEPEHVETAEERMARLLKAAGSATNFLAVDLGKNLAKAKEESATDTSSTDHHGTRRRHSFSGNIQRLEQIAEKAREYSRRCNTGWGEDGDRYAVECAEALGTRIERALSVGITGNGTRRNDPPHNDCQTALNYTDVPEEEPLQSIQNPNERRELRQRLEAARDALLPVIAERTSIGSIRLALLALRARMDEFVEAGRCQIQDHDSGEKQDVKDMINEIINGMQLEKRLAAKADLSWVKIELQRLSDALDSRPMTPMESRLVQTIEFIHSKSESPDQIPTETPERAGEERDESPPPPHPISTLISAPLPAGNPGLEEENRSFIRDLLRKTSDLEQQMTSKADKDEVARALSSLSVKLRKISLSIPALEEGLSNKIEKKDLNKLAALISNGITGSASPKKRGEKSNDRDATNSSVLASRLNSKFRCLSCDRPLPALGPPGPPKLHSSGLSMAGAGTSRSPQRIARSRLTVIDDDASASRPNSPTTSLSSRHGDARDVIILEESTKITQANSDYFIPPSPGTAKLGTMTQEAGRLRRPGCGTVKHGGSSGEQPGRLEPIGANASGEQIAGVMSRYPRMMPPPSRIRTAAGGGGAGLGTRPNSSLGGRG